MDLPGEDGKPLRAKLEYIEQITGKRPAELDVPPIPWPAEDAFWLWSDLHSGRSQNGMGPTSLSWLDLDAWSRMRGRKPSWSELELIRTIDRAFLGAHAKREN